LVGSCTNGKVETELTEPTEEPLSGEVLYLNNCASCHGPDGKLGVSGASDLSSSQMTINEIKIILKEGRNGMPVMKEILGSDENIESVSNYVIDLKK
jgi:cytochrome c6